MQSGSATPRLRLPQPFEPYPPAQLRAATLLGKLIARGLLEHETCLGDLVNAALAAGYRGSRMGLKLTLSWRLRDAARTWELKRNWAVVLIGWKVRELVEARTPSAAMIAAARSINAEQGEPLGWGEPVEVVREHVARRVHTMTRTRDHAMPKGAFRHAA